MIYRKLVCTIMIAMMVLTTSLTVLAVGLPAGVPSTIEAATIEKLSLQKDMDGVPYFQFEIKIPQSILKLNESKPAEGDMFIDYFRKVDNGEWEAWDGGYLDIITVAENTVPGKNNSFYASAQAEDEGTLQETLIKEHQYSYKIQLSYKYTYADGEWDYIYAPFSNEKSIGSENFYSKASDWATPELTKAEAAGIIPDILKGADMTKSITREEFCELAVLLYEKVTQTKSQPSATNPFKDTTNAQILKAYALKITEGTSATTFSPQTLINREQCAAMLYRTIKAIRPKGDYSIAGVPDFPDQTAISDWAIEATKYMSKLEIIKGDSDGNFMPKATTTAQQATDYGMATREAAVLMAIRTYDKVK